VTVRYETVRDVGFFLFAAGWIVAFVNSGVIITDSLMLILDRVYSNSNLHLDPRGDIYEQSERLE
jgi:hypothetical protein